jgi:methionine-gamma-lyase
MKFNPADNIQDLQYFGEFGGVNPSISDSSYTFLSAKLCLIPLKAIWKVVIYILAIPPSNLYLDRAMAAMEGTETANVSASGMGLLRLLDAVVRRWNHIVSSRTIMEEHMLF